MKFPLILSKISLIIYQTISSNLQVPYHKNLFTSKQTSAAHFFHTKENHFHTHLIPSQEAVLSYHSFWIMPLMKKVVVYTFRSLNTIFKTFYTGSGASFDFYQSSRLRTFCQKYNSQPHSISFQFIANISRYLNHLSCIIFNPPTYQNC